MGVIIMYIFFALVKKYGLNMEDVREYEEEGGIYEGYGDMYGEECNELVIASQESMVEKEYLIEE